MARWQTGGVDRTTLVGTAGSAMGGGLRLSAGAPRRSPLRLLRARAHPGRRLGGHLPGRERTTSEAGISTLGFSEALLRLQTTDTEKVQIGSVNDLDHRRKFVWFVAAGGSRIVSCIGVGQRAG